MKKRVLLFLIGLNLLFGSGAKAQEEINILFIGNSFTFRHNLPELVKQVFEEGHPELTVNVEKVVYGGQNMFMHSSYYMSHTFIEQRTISDETINARINEMENFLQLTENPAEYQHFWETVLALDWINGTVEPISDKFENIARAINKHQDLLDNNSQKTWDYVVLQAWQDVHESVDEGYAYGVQRLLPTIEEQGAKVILYHTAPNVQNSVTVTGPLFQERVDYELPVVKNLAETIGAFTVVPVPYAINMIQQGGTDFTFSYINDFHPNQRSAFLTANLFYAAFFNEPTMGLNFNTVTETKLDANGKDPDGGDATVVFPTDEKEYLQGVAYDAIIQFNQLGEIVPVSGVSIGSCSDLKVGNTHQFSVTVAPTNASDKTRNWSSSNNSVASVNSRGLVTAVSVGSATITVTTNDGSFTDNCLINVIPEVTISGCPSDDLMEGNTHQLTAIADLADTNEPSLEWSSSNESVATVNTNGLVTAVSAGSATISVTTNPSGLTDSCVINVEIQNLIKNGDFSDGVNHWTGISRGGAAATFNVEDEQGKWVITQTGTNISKITLRQDVDFIAGHTYNVTFDFKGTVPTTGGIRYYQIASDGTRVLGTYEDVTTEFTEYSYSWTQVPSETVLAQIQLGQCTGTVYIDNVVLIDNGNGSSLSVDKTKLELVKLYPNPVNKGVLNVSTIVKIDKLQVFDLSGKMVHQELSLDTNKQIDLSELNKGVYIIQFVSSQFNESKKIVIE